MGQQAKLACVDYRKKYDLIILKTFIEWLLFLAISDISIFNR
jgi:hypothetical protein